MKCLLASNLSTFQHSRMRQCPWRREWGNTRCSYYRVFTAGWQQWGSTGQITLKKRWSQTGRVVCSLQWLWPMDSGGSRWFHQSHSCSDAGKECRWCVGGQVPTAVQWRPWNNLHFCQAVSQQFSKSMFFFGLFFATSIFLLLAAISWGKRSEIGEGSMLCYKT